LLSTGGAWSWPGTQEAREKHVLGTGLDGHLAAYTRAEACVLEQLGRLDDAMALDAEWAALNHGKIYPEAAVRRAIRHVAKGEDAEAEEHLRGCLHSVPKEWHHDQSRRTVEEVQKPHIMLAELLERKGTEEALAEARTLRDEIAQQLAEQEARRAAALEETRAAAAEAVRQWREERSKAREKKIGSKGKKKGKGKGKKKGRGGKAKGKRASSAAAIEGEQAPEPCEGHAAAVEGVAAAEGEEQESQPPDEAEEREECAVCLQDLIAEDDEDPCGDEGGEGEALVVLRCGHRFHEICGDMWCAKCADKGWGVTCPRCRAPYVVGNR
jgi:hypothetical protein